MASAEELQDALDECSLQHWISKTQALPSRFDAARHAAVQLLKPNVAYVAIPKRTLNNEAELKVWLAEVEQLLAEKLKDGRWPCRIRVYPVYTLSFQGAISC